MQKMPKFAQALFRWSALQHLQRISLPQSAADLAHAEKKERLQDALCIGEVSVRYFATQSPDFPPCFSINRTSPITIPRSTALHMS